MSLEDLESIGDGLELIGRKLKTRRKKLETDEDDFELTSSFNTEITLYNFRILIAAKILREVDDERQLGEQYQSQALDLHNLQYDPEAALAEQKPYDPEASFAAQEDHYGDEPEGGAPIAV